MHGSALFQQNDQQLIYFVWLRSRVVFCMLVFNAVSLSQVSLATVIFVASQSSLSAEVKSVIKQQLEYNANGWTVYRIARQASRMVIVNGLHLFANTI